MHPTLRAAAGRQLSAIYRASRSLGEGRRSEGWHFCRAFVFVEGVKELQETWLGRSGSEHPAADTNKTTTLLFEGLLISQSLKPREGLALPQSIGLDDCSGISQCPAGLRHLKLQPMTIPFSHEKYAAGKIASHQLSIGNDISSIYTCRMPA